MENMSGSMNEKMVSQEHDTERTINRKDNKAKNEALTYIRDYRVMTNFKYRLITNILIPLLAIFTSMLISCSKTCLLYTSCDRHHKAGEHSGAYFRPGDLEKCI